MKLHEAIEKVLKEAIVPLSAKEIADIINYNRYYIRTDKNEITSSQVLSRVKNYPLLFQNINGQILLLEENNFKNIITSYSYLANLLRGIYNSADIQFIIAVLLFYKRLIDINEKHGRRYPINHFDEMGNSFDRLIDGGNTWIKNLKDLEIFFIGPEGVFEECSSLLLKLDNNKKIEIWHIISQLDTTKIVDKEFGDIYQYLINSYSSVGNKSNIFYTPLSLNSLMVDLLNPQGGKTIYDPVAGSGSLLIQAIKYNDFNNSASKGTEINKRIAQLGNLNLIVNGLSNYSIESKDCFYEVNHSSLFDYIIADLPIDGVTNSYEHLLLYNNYGIEAPKSGKGFGSLVLFVLSKLKADGKAVITVSDNFLVKKGKENDIRDILVSNDFIESIISLPAGTLRPHTDAKASILVINKLKKTNLKNKIRFIKAKAIDIDKKSMIIDNESVLKSYFGELDYSKNNQVVDLADLRNNNILSAEAYDTDFIISNMMLSEGTGKHLADLVEIKAGTQPDKDDLNDFGEISLVRIENLSREILDINLTKDLNHSVTNLGKYNRHVIQQDCILVARIGDNLKPTFYKHSLENKPIMLHSGVYALIPSKRKNKLSLEYLYYQLHSAFILEQIKNKKLGAVMPYISIAGLSQIVIPYVNSEIQESFVNAQKANLIAEEKARFEERFKELGYIEEVEEKESEIVKTLTHQLRPSLMIVYNQVKRINNIIKTNKLTDYKEFDEENTDLIIDPELNAIIQKPDNYSLGEFLEKLSDDTKQLNDILTNVDKVMNFKLDYIDFEEIDIFEFFNEYKKMKEIEITNKYKIVIKGEHVDVSINKSSFKELLDQLLLNAERHGFLDEKKSKSFKVQFNIKQDLIRNVLVIDYTNNGLPFLLEEKDFITPFEKGKTSNGSGIGGNYIFRIIKAHQGKISVQSKNTKGFSMEIEIPLNKNYE